MDCMYVHVLVLYSYVFCMYKCLDYVSASITSKCSMGAHHVWYSYGNCGYIVSWYDLSRYLDSIHLFVCARSSTSPKLTPNPTPGGAASA